MLLSLDLAFEHIGWSVFHEKHPIDMGMIHVPKSGKKTVRVADERADRCAAMVGQLMDIIFKHKIPGIIGELPSGSQNAVAANLLGWANGSVVSLCRILNLPAEWVSPNDVKLAVAGNGRGPHTFRHYTATYLYYDGNMRIEDLAYLLGDKVETIREKYLHPTPKMLRKRVASAMGWRGWDF